MAVLTPTKITNVVELGGAVMQIFRVSVVNNAAADEWVDTGLSKILGVVGWAFAGTAAPLATTADTDPTKAPTFVLNARGTGVAEGTNLGDLGVELFGDAGSTNAGGVAIDITVVGLP